MFTWDDECFEAHFRKVNSKHSSFPANAGKLRQVIGLLNRAQFFIFKATSLIVMPKGFTYIISNKRRTVLYIGVSSDIKGRMYKHKKRVYDGFAKRYNCEELIYFEEHTNMADAIKREKQMKRWSRAWKWKVIKEFNSELKDLSADWFNENWELIK